ncbi:PAP2 superfamily protein [Prevotella sp. khp7]|uniref:phosphatase PAP2 family protein n=1 Tax=Prevotella sp. khp7 TaxID=1761885 RepID=UPI0008D3AC29|nr:phosphatase PAP2 family protein [Prevotella sp. khp7]SEW16443.1 PAP2 superfamily protein [Prevotella sp. khp7]
MKRLFYILLCLCCSLMAHAQQFEKGEEPRTVKTNSFWSDWFLQMDLDMSLQNPYGYNFAHVFPNGKSFGMDVALGKWFTPQVGLRGKFNWENKLPLLENEHANWLAPFYQPGENRRKGGYIALYEDVLVNLHNLFGEYKEDRAWNLTIYPRIGVNYNFGVSKGALLAGAGIINSYRLDRRWSLYLDVAYILSGSGFVGSESNAYTGVGSNSNGYFSIGMGAQMNLGKSKQNTHSVLTNGFWDNWFIQTGMDMSLINPYGCDFSRVFPKGKTYGVNLSMGKWFSPEYGLRARVQWDNGLIENHQLEWLPPRDNPSENFDKYGFASVSLDAMLNLTNAFVGYDAQKKWHTSAYLRMGVVTQFVEHSGSPLMGAGIEQTYRLNDKWSLYSSFGYQVTTSEGIGVSSTGMDVAAGSNGFFDIDLGIKLDLGRNKFYRDEKDKRSSWAETVSKHNWSRFLVNTAASLAVTYGVKTVLKKTIKEDRPDHSDKESFPSGHAALAFAGATSLHKEFGKECPWVSVAGFGAATIIGVERAVNKHHHWYDVVAGAGIGIASTEFTWWLSDKLFKTDKVAVGVSGNNVSLVCGL